MDWFADCFLPGMADEDRRSPEVSPLYAELRNDLPPALFSCGTADPLLDGLALHGGPLAAGGQ